MNEIKSNIGILLPRTNRGGHFQLALSIADSLIKYSRKFNYTILYYDRKMLDWLSEDLHVNRVQIRKSALVKRINTFINLFFNVRMLPMSNADVSETLKKAGIDLLIVPFHGLFGYMNDIPYLVTITNLMYKYYPRELGHTWKENIVSDLMNKTTASHAALSIVDSQQGMEDLNRFFKIPREKIGVIPHIPPGYIYRYRNMDRHSASKILAKYKLPENYIFYPSVFWYYKNHDRLIKSLARIHQLYGTKIHLVLVGHPLDNYKNVVRLIKELGIADQISFLGFVSETEMVALYKRASALVYPSLFGPTNIPPLEAMILGIPVLCSNLFSMPEQVGDAALLFDPFNIEDIAEKIFRIWTDEDLRTSLVQKGYERIKNITQQNYAMQWETVIEKAIGKI